MDMVLNAKTLGRSPGHVVMSIGATLFDRNGKGQEFLDPAHHLYVPISVYSSQEHKLVSDPSTLSWWRKQPVWSTVGKESMESKTSVEQACDRLRQFIERHQPQKIWSNSPTFHVALINALYSKLGQSSPIHYRQEADFRTLMDLVYVDRQTRPHPVNSNGFMPHHALGDSIYQAQQVRQAICDIHPVTAMDLERQKWVMLDIETLGTKPGYGIMSIGATVFGATSSKTDLLQGEKQFYTVINNFDMLNCGFKVDPETLKWWRQEPIWDDLSTQIRDSTTSVLKACRSLADFLNKHKPDKVWANSPSFDIEMLRAVFKRMKVDLPIHYRQEMDFRTVMELAYPLREQRPDRQLKGWFPGHHALGDAMEQSIQTQLALEQIGIVPRAEDANLLRKAAQHKRKSSARMPSP